MEAAMMGSASSDATLLAGLRTAAPKMSLHLRYGLSEAFGALTRFDVTPDSALPSPGLVGLPLEGVTFNELEGLDGEPIEVRVRTATAAREMIVASDRGIDRRGLYDGSWLPTGDLGLYDEAGLHLRGRLSQMIKHRGHRVDPGEIERVLLSTVGITEAVVVGVADPMVGQTIVALIEGDVPVAELQEICRESLSAHKQPSRIESVSMPRTPSGKPDRRAARNLAEGKR